MKIIFDSGFLEKLKRVDVRIRMNVKRKIDIFSKNPNDLQLNNHPLQKEYRDYRSINLTADYRAIYKEVIIEDEVIAYFVIFGTHKELYS